MGFVLDHIIKDDRDVSEIISADYESPEIFEIDRIESAFTVTVELKDGIAPVTVTLKLQGGTNGLDFADMEDAVLFQDTDGSVTFDVLDTGMLFVRIAAVHTEGSITIDRIRLTGKRRH